MAESKADLHELLNRKREREAVEDKEALRKEIDQLTKEFEARGGRAEQLKPLERDLKSYPYNNRGTKK